MSEGGVVVVPQTPPQHGEVGGPGDRVRDAAERFGDAAERIGDAASRARNRLVEEAAALRPRARGHLHQWAFVVSLATGALLVALAPTGRARVAAVVYALSVSLLFGTSALYHRRIWQPRQRAVMKRLDHSMILVLIAGTYTPFAMLVLTGTTGTVVLCLVWGGAAAGIAMRLLWLSAPPWATVVPYLVVGWVALGVIPQMYEGSGLGTLVLLFAGGLCYTLGAVVYATRRPDPWPRTFGYHEVFHLLTLVAGLVFYVAVSVAVYGAA